MKYTLCVCGFLLCFQVNAFDLVSVDSGVEILNLFGKTYLYTGEGKPLHADEVLKMPEAEWTKKALTGYSRDKEWILIPFENKTDIAFDKVFYLSNHISHKIDYYFVENGELLPQHIATGLARSADVKLFNGHGYPARIHFPARSVVYVLVAVEDPMSSINVPIFLLSYDKAIALKDQNIAVNFLWLGVLLLSLVLAVFMYVVLRRELFLYYLGFAVSTGIIVTSNSGIIFLFVDSDPHQLITNYYQIGAVIMILFMPRFINCIVPIRTISQLAWRGVTWMGYTAVGIAMLYTMPYFKFSFFFTNLFINTMVSFSALLFLYLLITLLVAALRKMKHSLTLFVVYFIYLSLAFSNVILPLLGMPDRGLNDFYYVLAGSIFETIAFTVLMAQVTLGVYKDRERLNLQVQQNQERMMEAIVQGQEEERHRFAKDLHDGFGQLISSLMLNLRGLDGVNVKNVKSRHDIFQAATSILNEMYVELKNVCFNLMPQTLIKAGVGAALQEFADRINQSGAVEVRVSLYDINERLTDVQEISLYRITQEWVNNVIKYNTATAINIQITKDENELTLLIEDNGEGFERVQLTLGKGNGWKNIISRAGLIKGDVELDTTPGLQGNTFILNAPVYQVTQQPLRV